MSSSSSALDVRGLSFEAIARLPLFERVSLVRRNSAFFSDPALFDECARLYVAVTSSADRNKKLRERLWPGCMKAALAYRTQSGERAIPASSFSAFMASMLALEGFWSDIQRTTLEQWARGDFSLIAHTLAHSQRAPLAAGSLRRLRVAERVLLHRSVRYTLVMAVRGDVERHDAIAVLRTAECMGVQRVWIALDDRASSSNGAAEDVAADAEDAEQLQRFSRRITRGNEVFLSVRVFASAALCADALRLEQLPLWALTWAASNSSSTSLASLSGAEVPERLAVAMSASEVRPLCAALQACALRSVHVPLVGFGTTLPLSVHAALVMQRLFALAPEARGDLAEDAAASKAMRAQWYAHLFRKSERSEEYAPYLEQPPPPIDELRRALGEEHDEAHWMPKKVKRRIDSKEAERRQAAAEPRGEKSKETLHFKGFDSDSDDSADAMDTS